MIKEIRKSSKSQDQLELDTAALSFVNVDQFYGIEISQFPVRIAESALWMMDHIMNNKLSKEFGKSYLRIPITKSPNIHCFDALETNWNQILPPEQCSYILGNPPFVGSKRRSEIQKYQMKQISQKFNIKNILDYVTAWFLKAGEYIQDRNIKIGFVATSSISQGEQCAQIWSVLFNKFQLEIEFAYQPFPWSSDAPSGPSVSVIILGITGKQFTSKERLLYTYDNESQKTNKLKTLSISPYLFDAKSLSNPHLTVKSNTNSISGLPQMKIGSKPIDKGNYIFTNSEKLKFMKEEPGAKNFFRPFIGNDEFVNGTIRWILTLEKVDPRDLSKLPKVRERVTAVKNIRLQSVSSSTRELAKTPQKFHVTVIPKKPFLVIPEINSRQTDYIPIGWLKPPVIPSNLLRVVEGGRTTIVWIINFKNAYDLVAFYRRAVWK